MRVWFWLWLLLSVPALGETIRLYDYHQHPPSTPEWMKG